LQKEYRRAHRNVLRSTTAGDEALTKALTTARLLDQQAMAMLDRYEALEKTAKASRAVDRAQQLEIEDRARAIRAEDLLRQRVH
jgi:hypothetical protein